MSAQSKDHTPQYCIVSTGRSGSSLLASILAHSGADFGLTASREWNKHRGEMEHPLLHEAYAHLTKMERINNALMVPNSPFKKRYRRKLLDTLSKTRDIPYLKSTKLGYLVPYLAEVNHSVKVLIIYRDFLFFAKSLHFKCGNNYTALRSEYLNMYNTALLQLELFGGTIIHYTDLIDKNATQALEALSKVTGIDREVLRTQRDDIVSDRDTPEMQKVDNTVFSELLELQQQMHHLKNTVVS